MASRYEVEVTLTSAKDLKNVNWRHGPVRPYAVVWVDPDRKRTIRADEENDTCPYWNETLVVPFDRPIEEATLYIDVVHAKSPDEDTKPLIGSAKLPLRDVADEAGVGGAKIPRSLQLRRPSGRPHGKVEVQVAVRDPRYRAPEQYYATPYGVRDREYVAPPAYGSSYAYSAPPPPGGYPYNAPPPPAGYPYNAPPPPQPAYGEPAYGQGSYGYVQEEKKKSKFGGMGTGLAVGAVAGALGGLALAEGFDKLEDHIEDKAAEKVEDDVEAGDDSDPGDDDGW